MSTFPRLTTATTAARIPYANAAPFYALWNEAPFAVRDLVPRELGLEAESGTVDMGLMATGDFLRLRDRFEAIEPAMGVATRGAVQSVLLYSCRPVSALAGATISVTPETSTSIRLLRLLLGVRRGLADVRYVRGLEPEEADAVLAIGDRAMRMRDQRAAGLTHVLDLGADWFEWTRQPFVFAIWAVRSQLDAELKRELGGFLSASLDAGLANLGAVARLAEGTGWNAEEIEHYLRHFRYRLGAEELDGLRRFEMLVSEHGLTDVD